jgi:hypothetical protein
MYEIAPKYTPKLMLAHFEAEHRQALIDFVRAHEPGAWRPKKRTCGDHEQQAAKCSGPDKMYCARCGKLIYKPEPAGRPDAPAVPPEAVYLVANASILMGLAADLD